MSQCDTLESTVSSSKEVRERLRSLGAKKRRANRNERPAIQQEIDPLKIELERLKKRLEALLGGKGSMLARLEIRRINEQGRELER